MELLQLISYFDTSPAMRLMRSSHAPYIVDFLHRQFKERGRLTIPMSELTVELLDHLEQVHASQPDVLPQKPEHYLNEWCTGDSRWLQRFFEASRNEPIYQLTPHTEEVFIFLDRALQKDLGFVGTESRLRMVISALADLVAGASDDPEVRLRHLRDQRARLDAEIDRVEREGVAAKYEPAVIRERFATAVTLLKQLMSDFRAVEERFRQITRDVQSRQSQGQDTRGNILAYALDAEDLLKKEDQGVSFYEFVKFILSPTQQERLQEVITELSRLDALAQQSDGLATVRRMVPLLTDEAEKVMRTNQRLSATLRRLLDARLASERQRLAQLLVEIKTMAAARSETAPHDSVVITIDTDIPLEFPLSRVLWTLPTQFTEVDLSEYPVDDAKRIEAFRDLASMHRLDWQLMRQRIAHLVEDRQTVTIGKLVEHHPPRAGVIELLGYLQIAREDGHVISHEYTEQVMIPRQDQSRSALHVTLPTVYFIARSKEVQA